VTGADPEQLAGRGHARCLRRQWGRWVRASDEIRAWWVVDVAGRGRFLRGLRLRQRSAVARNMSSRGCPGSSLSPAGP